MAYLSDEDRKYLQEEFAKMDQPVALIYFSQPLECQYCETMQEFLSEVAALSEKITLESHDILEDCSEAERFGIERTPALVVVDNEDHGIRYYGVPGGYEFNSLIESILDLSQMGTRLSEATRQALRRLERPIKIKVFITLNCPHCPRAVRIAHQMALESELVQGEMIEAAEFPELVQHYKIGAVPKIVINDSVEFEGALPEPLFLDHVLKANRLERG